MRSDSWMQKSVKNSAYLRMFPASSTVAGWSPTFEIILSVTKKHPYAKKKFKKSNTVY